MTYFEILPVADLDIEKILSNKRPNFPDEITWILKATNNGYNNVSDAYVIDKFSDGLIYNESDGNYNASADRWDIGTLNVNQTLYLVIKTILNITNTSVLNIATINSSTYNPNETNNVANNITRSNPLSDLNVVKLLSQNTSVIGDEITWTIRVTNKGQDIAVNAYAIDNLPSTVMYVSDDSKGKYNSATERWDIGNLTKEASAIVNIKTKVNVRNTAIENDVFVNSSTADSNMSNNSASNKTVVPDSNFVVEKNTITPIVTIGEQVKFQIVVRNTGRTNLTNVFVEKFSYDGLIFDKALNQTHWTESIVNGKHRWNLNNQLGIGENSVLTVLFNTTDVGTFTNVVVAGSNQTGNRTAQNKTVVVTPEFKVEKINFDKLFILGNAVTFEIVVTNTDEGNFTNAAAVSSDEIPNKTANDTVDVIKPEFSVEMIIVNNTIVGGNQVIFEIIINNYGAVDLNNVTVYESEFEGLTYAEWFDYKNTWIKNDDLSWTYYSTLESKKQADFFVVFNTTKVGNFTNIVVVKTNETEDISANNTTSVFGADLSVINLVSNKSPNYGDLICWTIIVTNNGPDYAQDVCVVDNLPNGLSYQSSKVDLGLFDPATGIWFISDLANGESAKMELYALVTDSKSSSIVNVAVVNGSTPDPNLDNNVANNNIKVNHMADLSVIKFVSNESSNYGDLICWTIIVTNNGPDYARDVCVVDNLPNGLSYQSSKVDLGLFDPATGIWFISDLANGESAKMELYALVTDSKSSSIVNVAVVNGSTPDPNLDNNIANNTTIINSAADLSIYKVVVGIDGDKVTWGIIVLNNGPDTAINTRVIDVLPKSLGFISYEASKGVFDYNTGVWSIGDMENGEEASILIETITIESGEIINGARVESDVYDPNMTNNYDYDEVVVEDILDEPIPTPESVDVLPATGNSLIMVLLALIALATGTLRRRK